jgi:hypothetical protein
MFEGKKKNLERKEKKRKHLKFSNLSKVAAYSSVLSAWQRPW